MLVLPLHIVTAMAGNIVPAIASTNAIVGGVIVMEALNVISSNIDKCKSVSDYVMVLKDYVMLIYLRHI